MSKAKHRKHEKKADGIRPDGSALLEGQFPDSNDNPAMSKAKHTPGPWELGGAAVSGITQGLIRIDGQEVVHVSGQDYHTSSGRISTISASKTVCYLNGDPNVSEHVKANARLIAKAPEMVELLRESWAYIATSEENRGDGSEILKSINALLAGLGLLSAVIIIFSW